MVVGVVIVEMEVVGVAIFPFATYKIMRKRHCKVGAWLTSSEKAGFRISRSAPRPVLRVRE